MSDVGPGNTYIPALLEALFTSSQSSPFVPSYPGFQSLHDLRRQTTGRSVPSTTCLSVLSVVLFLCFGFLLAWLISGRPDRSSTVVDTVTGDMSLLVRSSRSRVLISLAVGDEDELEEDVEQ